MKMQKFTAIIFNTKFLTFRTMEVNSFGMDGLRTRIENLYLKCNEELKSLFPSNLMPKDLK